jgi:hypothetical protein
MQERCTNTLMSDTGTDLRGPPIGDCPINRLRRVRHEEVPGHTGWQKQKNIGNPQTPFLKV